MHHIFSVFILIIFTYAGVFQQSVPTEYSHPRGSYSNSFYLTFTENLTSPENRFTTDCNKPDKNTGTLYSESIYTNKMTTIRVVTYLDTSESSEFLAHSFIFTADVLIQDNSGLTLNEQLKDHLYWKEEFDITNTCQLEQEILDALLDNPTVFISAPYDSIFEITGIHMG